MKKMYKPDNFLKTHDSWLVTTYMEKICPLNNKAVDELEEHFELHSELLVKVESLEKDFEIALDKIAELEQLLKNK